ncbi:DNA-binding transcriptional regulator, AcrR family [Streptomyces sp. 3213]|uniref:TetR/AcrR family transcriptional regulator n=1 Tax=Streptomyces sp. 3213.3 TaxID=1855348 RepID=UPI00089CC07B|nr:TetR/AcrR family transcriptional regulator [Streptomyces sp. 3213.3]SEC34346.1 DNA-binding transcriptional regulator, AcrR family [Streptomyces sp. 3213] [Streptomyces sp. 3213.3]
MASVQSTTKPSARERLLTAANELFYAEGVQSVGIDRVIEHAGVAKASLYNTIGGKEQLVRAYLDTRHASTADRITRAVAECDTPREQMLAVFDSQSRQFDRPDFHGCAFIRAGAEASPGGLVQEAADTFRGWMRELFTRLAADAGAADPDTLGHQLQFLYDGVGISALMDHDSTSTVAAASRAAASALIAAATGVSAEA